MALLPDADIRWKSEVLLDYLQSVSDDMHKAYFELSLEQHLAQINHRSRAAAGRPQSAGLN